MEKSGGSRLLQMQARFQQRQMQEKEHKILSLYEAQQARTLTRISSSSISKTTATIDTVTPSRQGKVRQMFEERRNKAGIDKSYPLQPIDRNASRRPIVNVYKPVKEERKPVKATINHTLRNPNKNIITNRSDVNHNIQLNSVSTENKNNNYYADASSRYSHREDVPSPNRVARDDVTDCGDNDVSSPQKRIEANEVPPASRPRRNQAPVSQKNVQKKRSVAASKQPTLHARSNASPARAKQSDSTPRVERASPITRASDNSSPQRTTQMSPKRSVSHHGSSNSSVGPSCSTCGRHFATDRLAKHEDICRKANAKKRKPYDALKHRLVGTEAEPFIKHIRKQPIKPAPAASQPSKADKPASSNWRKKHEEFINAIRAAKAVQAHIAAGGKLSDLPPPPPSENPDYVQCPHCERRFNQGAADRHIPKCASFQFNKPKQQRKPPTQPRKR